MTDEERKELEAKLKAEAEAKVKAEHEAELAKVKANAKAEAEAAAKVEYDAKRKAEKEEAERKRLAEEGKFKELADAAGESARGWESKFKSGRVDAVLVDEAIKAGAIDTDVVKALLGSKATCDDDGKVTIDGKSPAEAVKELLAAKPHLAKADGQPGSGSGAGDKGKPAGDINPFAPETFNVTKQAELLKESPDLARKLAAEAGVELW